MALLDNLESLPTPVKLAAAGGATVGLVVFLLNRNKTPQPSAATETAQSKVPPIYQLPPGAVNTGGGGGLVPTPTPPIAPPSPPDPAYVGGITEVLRPPGYVAPPTAPGNPSVYPDPMGQVLRPPPITQPAGIGTPPLQPRPEPPPPPPVPPGPPDPMRLVLRPTSG